MNMIDKNKPKNVAQKILDQTKGELEILRTMLSNAEERKDADAAMKLASTIARIIKDAYATQMQLEQMAVAMTLGRGMNALIPGGNTGRQQNMKGPSDAQRKPSGGGLTDEQIQHIGPLAVQALSQIAGISKNLGGNPPVQPNESDSDPASE